MWVRTKLTTERWTKEKTEPTARSWDVRLRRDVNRFPSWERGHLLADVASSTDVSTISSEGDCKEPDRCCWKHKQCTGHLIYPFASDCGRHSLHLHSAKHCDCNSSSSSWGADPTCSPVIKSPCFELTPKEEHVERFWYGWCKSYRPVSVAVIHHPLHHECGADDVNEEEEEEGKPPIPAQVGPATASPDLGTTMATGTPDSAAPITIWRSESPTGKGQGSKVIKKVKKKKEKEKDKEEDTDEKAKLKKKAKKGKLTKKKSLVKSEPSPPDVSRSLSPRQLARMSESSPESWEELESKDSYSGWGQRELSSEGNVESSSPRKRENTVQAKKTGAKPSQTRKVNKRKSPPGSNPNLS
ncbi:Protein PROCA1 [Plecturocebus cupreus]